MKNTSRAASMPGSRSFTQFRAARIRRVSFQWKQAGREAPEAKRDPKGGA